MRVGLVTIIFTCWMAKEFLCKLEYIFYISFWLAMCIVNSLMFIN